MLCISSKNPKRELHTIEVTVISSQLPSLLSLIAYPMRPTHAVKSLREQKALAALLTALILAPFFTAPAQIAQGGPPVPPRALWEQSVSRHTGNGPVLFLAFPRDGAIFAQQTARFGGSTEPGATLHINGAKVNLREGGAFAGTIPLAVGRNRIAFRASRNGKVTTQVVEVRRRRDLAPLPPAPLAVSGQIPPQPLGHLELLAGESMRVLCQGTPGATAYFQIGNRDTFYPMRELPSGNGESSIPGVFVGSYTVQESDGFDRARITITLETLHDDQRQVVSLLPSGSLTTGRGRIARMAEALRNDTGLYMDTSRDVRFLSAAKGTQFPITGRRGAMLRTELSPAQEAWVPEDQIQIIRQGHHAPAARLQRIEMAPWSVAGRPSSTGQIILVGGVRTAKSNGPNSRPPVFLTASNAAPETGFTFHLNQDETFRTPLPVRVLLGEEEKSISLMVYGLEAEPFHILPSATARFAAPWHAQLARQFRSGGFIREMECQPLDTRSTVFRLGLSRKVWGYQTVFAPNQFGLVLKAPPRQASGKGAMAGVRIMLDPGHGGSDPGAISNGGIREADANWVITQRVAALLRLANAEVMLTRDQDEYVSLNDRVEKINASGAHLFLSIHCDSVSEFSDPYQARGSSVYFFYPQGEQMAQHMRQTMAEALHGEVPFLKTGQRDFRVIRGTPAMPGALVECLYMSNPDEEILLLDAAFLDRLSLGIYNGLLSFLRNAGDEYGPNPAGAAARISSLWRSTGKAQKWEQAAPEQYAKLPRAG